MSIKTEYSSYLAEGSVSAARAAIADYIGNTAVLHAFSDSDAAKQVTAGKWSRKELLGHLVDSALNNTQRFVRAQIPTHLSNGVLRIAGYAQNEWVRVAAYQARPWTEIIDLWVSLNRNILHVIDKFDGASLGTPVAIGDSNPVPVEHVIVDYAGHLVHHHRQITQ
jgi:hypothetical protein